MLVRELLFELGFDSNTAERNAKRMDKVVTGLKKNLVRMGVAAGAAAIAAGFSASKVLDEYTALESRIKLVTNGLEGLKTAQEGIFDSAQKTGTAYTAVADLYIRLARSTRRFNYSQQQTLTVTETIQKAMVVSGDASSPGAKAALFQLGQGLQSGQLRGQELNSVLEQAPRLAEAIAAGMGIDPGDLRKTAEAGKITAVTVMDALLKQAKVVDAEFQQMATRQSQSRQRLINSYKRLVVNISKEEEVMDSLVGVWDSFRGIVESQEFKKSLRFFIQIFEFLAKSFAVLISLLSKIIGMFASLTDAIINTMGGVSKAFRLATAAILAFITYMAIKAIPVISLHIWYLYGLATAAIAAAGGFWALAASVLVASLPFLLATAAIVLLILAYQDLLTHLAGGDSVIGRLIKRWSNLGRLLADIFTVPVLPVQFLFNAVASLINLMTGSKIKMANFSDQLYNSMKDVASVFNNGDMTAKIAQGTGGGINQTNTMHNQFTITVPPGSNREQTEQIKSVVFKAVDDAQRNHYREALNNFPEVE